MKSVFSRVKMSKKDIFLVILFILFSAIMEVSLPTFMSKMLDNGIKTGDISYVYKIGIVMVIMLLIGSIFGIIGRIISAKITSKFTSDLRLEVFKKIQKFSSSEFDKFGTGSLITRSTSDITTIQRYLDILFRMGAMAPLMLVSGLVMATFTSLKLSRILLLSVPLLIISTTIIIYFMFKYIKKSVVIVDKINQLFLEKLEGIRVIRAFNKQDYEIKKFDNINEENMEMSRKMGILGGSIFPTISLVFGITFTLVMGFGSRYVANGEIEIGVLVANTQYMAIILFSIVIMLMLITNYPHMQVSINRIAEVLDTEISIEDGYFDASNKDVDSVEFKNVNFKYDDAEEMLLSDISFVAKKGEITSIIGSTGSGKSTILKLIPRFYDITDGEILIGGVKNSDYNLKSLRNLIGYVPQKSVLFSGTISSNINFADNDITKEDMKNIGEIACADEFIKTKENGYESEVLQGGSNFSGGQKQRLAIARGIAKNSPILLFDDSFSALDMKTDKEIRNNIKNNLNDKIILIVGQRISSIMDSDRIIVLDKGRIVGQGTHKELLRNCDVYKEIAVLQLGEEAENA